MSSEAHRNAFKRVLDQSYVNKDITLKRVKGIVGEIRACNSITFTKNEISPNTLGWGYVIAKGVIYNNPLIDSYVTTNLNENEQDEDPKLCQQFAKIIDSLKKGINPHDEIVETINLGIDKEKKEVKIVDNPERKRTWMFLLSRIETCLA